MINTLPQCGKHFSLAMSFSTGNGEGFGGLTGYTYAKLLRKVGYSWTGR